MRAGAKSCGVVTSKPSALPRSTRGPAPETNPLVGANRSYASVARPYDRAQVRLIFAFRVLQCIRVLNKRILCRPVRHFKGSERGLCRFCASAALFVSRLDHLAIVLWGARLALPGCGESVAASAFTEHRTYYDLLS